MREEARKGKPTHLDGLMGNADGLHHGFLGQKVSLALDHQDTVPRARDRQLHRGRATGRNA